MGAAIKLPTYFIQVFLGTPHQACSEVELKDQLYSLIHLPGPPIVDRPLQKLAMLLDQTQKINQKFAASRLLERVFVLNILPESPSEDDSSSSQSPFSRYTLSLSQSWGGGQNYEASVGHADLVRGDPQEDWRDWVASALGNPPYSCQYFPPKCSSVFLIRFQQTSSSGILSRIAVANQSSHPGCAFTTLGPRGPDGPRR